MQQLERDVRRASKYLQVVNKVYDIMQSQELCTSVLTLRNLPFCTMYVRMM